MQDTNLPSHLASPAWSDFNFGPDPARRPMQCCWQKQTDDQFVEMLNAYRPSGGLARINEVIGMTRGVCRDDVGRMAAWILDRKAMSFKWQDALWLPLFQFNRFDMTLRRATAQVIGELNPVLEPWALASWFARPHALLANRLPADLPDSECEAVLRAARAEPPFAIAVA